MPSLRFRTFLFALTASLTTAGDVDAQPNHVTVVADDAGWKLRVDGQDFMVFGMNWGYIPIGENYSYNLWEQPDAFIEQALDTEMSLLRDMGVNALRLFSEIPPLRELAYEASVFFPLGDVDALADRMAQRIGVRDTASEQEVERRRAPIDIEAQRHSLAKPPHYARLLGPHCRFILPWRYDVQ